MDFKKHLETAWNLMVKYIAPLIFMTLVMIIVCVISFGILSPAVLPGFIYSILMMVKEGREPKIQDIFSQMKLFLPILGFWIVVSILTFIGFRLFVLPGIAISLAVTFFCIYVIPLMVDQDMGLIDAIKKSYAMSLEGEVIDHLVVVLLFIGITAVGYCIFGIGELFAQPFATIFLISVYLEKVKSSGSKEKPKIESGETT